MHEGTELVKEASSITNGCVELKNLLDACSNFRIIVCKLSDETPTFISLSLVHARTLVLCSWGMLII